MYFANPELLHLYPVLDQLLLKCISITKYKLLSQKIFQILFSITLSTKAEIQNTKYIFWKVIKIQITFNCHVDALPDAPAMADELFNNKTWLHI